MRLPSPIALPAALALAAALSIPACAPDTTRTESEWVDRDGSEVTGSLPVGTVLVATTDVNLRKGPGTSYGIVDVVPAGHSVTVAASTPQHGYYEVRYGTEVGWSSGSYYKLGPSSSSSSSTASSSTSSSSSSSSASSSTSTSSSSSSSSTSASSSTSSSSSSSSASSSSGSSSATLVATSDVNLRSGPGTSYAVLDVVPDGSTVTLLDPTEQNGFYNVQYQGEDGWCSASYLEASSSSSSSSSGGAATWSCTGSYGTTKMANGQYYATEFGCYLDSNDVAHQDPGDNCIPACLSQARSSGLCAGMSGPDCEESVAWYAADGARFGCLARLQVTNPQNGKAVVVVALDYGPACSVEDKVSHAAIDLSYPADDYLFGGETGISDKALVVVTEVAASTPLGPVL